MKKKALIICTGHREFYTSLLELENGLEYFVINKLERDFLSTLRQESPDVILVHVDSRTTVAWENVCREITSVTVVPIVCICQSNGNGKYLEVVETAVQEPKNHAELIAVAAELWRLAHRGASLSTVPFRMGIDVTVKEQTPLSTLRFLEWTTITAALFSALAGMIAYLITQNLEKTGVVLATVFVFIVLTLTGKPVHQMIKTLLQNLTRKPPS